MSRSVYVLGMRLVVIVSGIKHSKVAVRVRRYFYVLAFTVFSGIGNQHLGDIVFFAGIDGVVQLPQVFEAGRIVNGLPGFFAATFVGTVVHDGHPGTKRFDNGLVIGLRKPMVGAEIEINRSNQIIRTSQFALFSFGEIAKIDETEFSIGDQYSK